MSAALILAVALLLLLVVQGARLRADRPTRAANPLRQLGPTARRLYTRRNFIRLAGATVGGAVLAWSGADEAFDEWHRENVRSGSSDAVAKVAKGFGENEVAIAALAYALADWALPGTAIGRWGRQCFTATACGLPVLWSWQRALGGSRPSDHKPYGAQFRPLVDKNSVSGHTFIAAIPFLVAAREVGHPLPAWGLRALSPVTGWSRVNDERHYLSQVLLGYGLAWECANASRFNPGGSSPEATPTE